MKFELEKFNRNITKVEMLKDLKRCFDVLSKNNETLSFRSYSKVGKYSAGTIATRFGSWNHALQEADLDLNEEKDVSKKDLFLNLEKVWTALGRQPVTRDLVKPFSKYTSHIYRDRFGGYRQALEAFVTYINEVDSERIAEERKPDSEMESLKVKKKDIS